jgi:hypothetical protein
VGLVVDRWGDREDSQQAGPGKREEVENEHCVRFIAFGG